MRIYLAGYTCCENYLQKELNLVPYLLESFYTLKKTKKLKIIKNIKKEKFLLDSGAFTFMNSYKGKINWDKYIEDYANFINEYDIKYFFELDIDNIIGIKEVERLRNKLEILSGKKCIPVWHKSRGLEYWKKTCKEYDYIAIGGIVTKEIKATEYDIFIPLLKIAKENNCKVHGLGFTRVPLLKKYHFYSVDSTAWLSGSRFGTLHQFNNKRIESKKIKGKRIKDYKEINKFNLEQWIKFQNYADKYL